MNQVGDSGLAQQSSLATPATQLTVLLFTDIVGSTQLKEKLGGVEYTKLLRRHNELFDAGLKECRGAQTVKHTGDGYFASFPTASDAVRFALLFQARMTIEPWGARPISTRVGIHIGEVAIVDMAGRRDVVGFSADVAARIMSLALGKQILLTRQAFNDARQFVSQAPDVLQGAPPLRWMAHGPYLFKGTDEPLDVYEVGIEGVSPLMRPPDGDKVRHVAAHDQEPTLGWRPAVSLPIPGKPGWELERKLGEGGFGEVWLGIHRRIGERRVFKFCFDAERLRSLKRELALFRLLREELGQRDDIATLHDVKLDEPPFFLESEYTAGGNLVEWSQRHGGIDKLPLERRVELMARVADAVAAAHSVGVLHKDIKPANILIHENSDGTISPRLSDFGIGMLADRNRLQGLAITESGFTQLTEEHKTTSGSRMYLPPETMLDKPFTTQGDVWALGVCLYQAAVGDLNRPLAPGWERDVPDELLREDIAEMVEGDPQRRIASASDVARRLRELPQRRADLARMRQQAHFAQRRRQLTRVALGVAILVTFLLGVIGIGSAVHIRKLQRERGRTLEQKRLAEEQKHLAELHAAESQAVADFLIDMFDAASPDNTAQGDVSAQELVRQVVPRIGQAFADRPVMRARLQHAVAQLFASMRDWTSAEPLFNDAVETRGQHLGADHPDTIESSILYAEAVRGIGDLERAEALARKALDQATQVLGRDHPVTLLGLHAYAATCRSLRQYDKAEPFARDAYEGRKRVLGELHRDTIRSLLGVVATLRNLNRTSEAADCCRRAMDCSTRAFGADDPLTFQCLNSLARVYVAAGNFTEAEKCSRQGWEGLVRMRGPDDRSTLFAQSGYADALGKLGRRDQAERLFSQAVELAQANPRIGRNDRLVRRIVETYAAFLDGHDPQRAAILRLSYGVADPATQPATQPAAS
jgi:serine/threonine-protein kinase